eukprot:2488997-Alexandrium_andersonii.AAC.1
MAARGQGDLPLPPGPAASADHPLGQGPWKVKGNPKINTGHNFLKDSAEAWAELARRRKAWEGESGSTEL